MKTIFLIITVLFSLTTFSQDKSTSNIEEQETAFAMVEKAPVYSGCDENMGNQALKECMSSQIGTLVSKNFNTKLIKTLNLPSGKYRISVAFKVNKEGNIIGIKAKAPHPDLEKEAVRIVKLIPKLDKPGIQKGKPVIVPYGFPIKFVVEEAKPLSKKEQRRLNRKKNS